MIVAMWLQQIQCKCILACCGSIVMVISYLQYRWYVLMHTDATVLIWPTLYALWPVTVVKSWTTLQKSGGHMTSSKIPQNLVRKYHIWQPHRVEILSLFKITCDVWHLENIFSSGLCVTHNWRLGHISTVIQSLMAVATRNHRYKHVSL